MRTDGKAAAGAWEGMSIETRATDFRAFGQAGREDDLPAEPLKTMLNRWVLGCAWALKPPRILGVPATLASVAAHGMGFGLKPGELPDSGKALRYPDGFCGVAPDLSVDTVMRAYARGLFPFCHIGPMKWWAPKQRMVLDIADFKLQKSLRQRLRAGVFRITFDQDFLGVMRACAEKRHGRLHLTWIGNDIMKNFMALHRAGHAHSFEVWDKTGALIGGGFGLAVGRVFFTESLFTRANDASKAGWAVLNRHMQHWGFTINDGKHWSGYMESLGFKLMPRAEFNAVLKHDCALQGRAGRWSVDPDLDTFEWDPSAAQAA